MTPSRIFCVFAILAGLAFIFATPPLRYPDERGHYLRAASVAGSVFHGGVRQGDIAVLPGQVAEDLDYFAMRTSQVTLGKPFDLDELIARIRFIGAADSTTVQETVSPMQMMSASLGYLPQAVAYQLASRAGAGFLLSLWAVRVTVLFSSVIVTVVAIKLIPDWARWTGVAVNLLPMTLYLRGSSSPDAMVTAMAFLGVAAFLRGARRGDITWPAVIAAFAACLYVAVVKPPYICLLLLGLLWLQGGKGISTNRRVMLAIVGMIGITTLAAVAFHSHDVAQFASRLRPDLAPVEFAPQSKLHMLLVTPVAVAAVFARTLLAVPGMVYSAIARFGWSDINPSPLLHVVVTLWFSGVAYLDRRRIVSNISSGDGVILLSTFGAQVGFVVLTMWLAWTDVMAPMIQGVQGRYFLPLLLCGALGGSAFLLRPLVRKSEDDHAESPAGLPYFLAGGAALVLAASVGSVILGEFFNIQGFQVICLHGLCKAR